MAYLAVFDPLDAAAIAARLEAQLRFGLGGKLKGGSADGAQLGHRGLVHRNFSAPSGGSHREPSFKFYLVFVQRTLRVEQPKCPSCLQWGDLSLPGMHEQELGRRLG